jgi:hypothetical protein
MSTGAPTLREHGIVESVVCAGQFKLIVIGVA